MNDAEDIKSVLSDPSLCAYPPGQVTLLTDAMATRTAIRAALTDLAARSGESSTVFIFYAGHGGRIVAGPHSGEYLLPVETKNGSEQELADSALPAADFAGLIKRIPAQKMVVVLDCCHAQGIGLLRGDASEVREGLSSECLDRLAAGRGRVVLAAAQSDEAASDGSARNGLFTKHLLAGLRGGAGGSDEFIRIFDLFNFVQPRVTNERARQHPVFKAELLDDFPVALRLGGRGEQETPTAAMPSGPVVYSRAQILRIMSRLIPGQFDYVLAVLNIREAQLSSRMAPQVTRASEVLQVAEQPGGMGLAEVTAVLREVLPNLK